MEMIVNFMLVAASGSAAVYCFILNRKLQGLKDTEKGLGATIASMAQAVEQAQSAVALAKQSSAESIDELEPLVAETRAFMPKLTELVESIGDIADASISGINDATTAATIEIEACLEKVRRLQADMASGADNQAAAPSPDQSDAVDTVEFLEREPSPREAPPSGATDNASTETMARKIAG